jgi:RNA polymerase sigma factor (sigma-70 family)
VPDGISTFALHESAASARAQLDDRGPFMSVTLDAASDVELVASARAGSQTAVVHLWTRHYPVALAAARRYARQPRDAEEMASDAFTGMLSAMSSGGGPTGSVRAYLLTSVRNQATSRARRSSSSEVITDEVGVLDRPMPGPRDPVARTVELRMVREAFAMLPSRWQVVLWRSAVDHDSNIAIGEDLGMSPNAVAALAKRARFGLRESYLRVHLSSLGVAPACAAYVDHLARFSISASAVSAEVEAHVAACDTCSERVQELLAVDGRMSTLLAPTVLALMPARSGPTTIRLRSRRLAREQSWGLGVAAAAAAAGMALAAWLSSPIEPDSNRASRLVGVASRSATAVGESALAPSSPPAPDGPVSFTGSTTSSDLGSPSPSLLTRAPTPRLWTTIPPLTPAPFTATVAPSVTPTSYATTQPFTTTTPSSTPSALPSLALRLVGDLEGSAIDVTLAGAGTIGQVQLTVVLPEGSMFTGSSGDWSGCQQENTIVNCRAAHSASGTWAGTRAAVSRSSATGRVSGRAVVRYPNGQSQTAEADIVWPHGSANESARSH